MTKKRTKTQRVEKFRIADRVIYIYDLNVHQDYPEDHRREILDLLFKPQHPE